MTNNFFLIFFISKKMFIVIIPSNIGSIIALVYYLYFI